MTDESQALRDARIDIAAVLGAVVRRLPRIILVTLMLLAATFVFLMFQPRLYESGAGILVEPRNNAYTRAANEQAPSASASDASVVSSQIELIKSRDTLLRVIEELDLRSVPEFNGSTSGPSPLALISQMLGRRPAPANIDETVLNNLLDRLTVIQERDSRIISVLVRSTDPDLAAAIANALARAHVERRAGLSLSDTAEASSWLGSEIERLRVAVTAAESAVANFKIEKDLFVGANNTSLVDQQLSTIANQISAAQERKNTALSRAALIRGLIERGQPIEGVADVRESTVIQQLSQEKARLQGERAQQSARLLPNHPTIQAFNAQISELDNQMSLEGRRVADALEAESQIEADLEISLRGEMDRVKGSASTATQDSVTLDSLQREATAQRNLLEGYLQRYGEAVSRTDVEAALPDVRVVTLAAPSVTPASPRTQLILLAVGIVSLASQIGIVIFGELMSGRAIIAAPVRERPQDELEAVPFVPEELEDDQLPEPVAVEAEPEAETPPEDDIRARYEALLEEIRRRDALEALAGPEPEAIEVEPETPVAPLAATPVHKLSDDLAHGRTRLLVLAGARSHAECEALADGLIADVLAKGISVALVDAGSAETSDELGITDLSLDSASFGDVVHKSDDNTFAEVPWGKGGALDRRSPKPFTLIEALGDIYEVVIVMTGRADASSSLPLFADLDGRLVLVADDLDEPGALENMRADLASAGFGEPEIVAADERLAA